MSKHQLNDGEERIEALGLTGLKILQPVEGYRFSIDPVLLCGFAVVSAKARVIDLGTGNGVIPLLLSQLITSDRIVGVERHQAMAMRAQRSVELNGLQEKISIRHADIRSLPQTLNAEGFDAVFANPPYRSCQTGRVAPDGERAAARHELAGDVTDFVRVAAYLLKQGGCFNIVFLAERLVELMGVMSNFRLEPKRLRLVHGRDGQPAKLVLVEGRKNARPGLHIEPPLIIYESEGRNYTLDVLNIYHSFQGESGTESC